MAMPRTVRHINEIRVLDTLFREGPMSRAELARRLNLTRSTTSSIVASLTGDNLLLEDAAETEERNIRTGRPSTDIRLNPLHSTFIGADIGVGQLTVVALDLTAAIIAREVERFEPGEEEPSALIEKLSRLIERACAAVPAQSVRGLNVTVPGLLDRDGNVLRAPVLKWSKVPLLPMLHARLPDLANIGAENDANAFAMAAIYQNNASVVRDALYVFLDTGVGGAIMSEGRLMRGHDGFAGEIGHIYVGEKGFSEIAGLPGSLENFIGREAILARFRHYGGAANGLESYLEALARGDSAAQRVLGDWSTYLGRGLATLTSTLNPQKIVLGGPVAALFTQARAAVIDALTRHMVKDHPLPDIELSRLGADGPAVGAAAILHRAALSFDEDLVFSGAR